MTPPLDEQAEVKVSKFKEWKDSTHFKGVVNEAAVSMMRQTWNAACEAAATKLAQEAAASTFLPTANALAQAAESISALKEPA